jgi:5'-nucleotidase / UDP-sugar diphosphatase
MDKFTEKHQTFLYLSLCASFLLFAPMASLSQVRQFTILHTSDEHSVLFPLPLADYETGAADYTKGGYARLATLVERIRNETEEPVLLFSSGDIIGGTPFSWLILEGYSPEIEFLKMVGYDGMTLGNHEFDYGPDILAEYLLRAGYPQLGEQLPLIASNLSLPERHMLLEAGIRENHIYKLPNGISLGVFGLLGKSAYDVATSAEPAEITDPMDAALQQVTRLREAGADVIIAITHSGIDEDRKLALGVDGIDIILGGHDHLRYEPDIVNNTYIIHSGNYLQYLGNYEFEWNSDNGRLSLVNDQIRSPYFIPLDHLIDEDPEILEMAFDYLEKLNEFVSAHTEGRFTDVREPLVFSSFPLKIPAPFTETAVGNFVTDAMRLMAGEVTGEKVDIAFQGNGVIRADIIPGAMEWSEGRISFFDLVTVSGLGSGADGKAGYPLVSIYLTGREVLNILEISALLSIFMGDNYFLQASGLRYNYDPGQALWLRIPFGGPPVPAYRAVARAELYTGEGIQDDISYAPIDGDDDRLYHVVTDYYLTSFLPMVGDILPRLRLVPKDRNGHPLEPEQAVIIRGQREYKIWEAVAEYAVSFEVDENIGMPVVPLYYSTFGDRIVLQQGMPLKYWSYFYIAVILAILLVLALLAARKVKQRRLTHRRRQP